VRRYAASLFPSPSLYHSSTHADADDAHAHPQETESFRQLVFDNLTRGLKYLLDALPDMGLALPEVYSNLDGEGWVLRFFL
jgi:hypothetical protein